MQRCTDQRGDSLSQKRIPPLEPPEKGLGLAVSGLNNSDVSEVKVPRARRCRISVAIRFDLLLLSAVAQPLAALLPYGCGTPLAGAALESERKCSVITCYRWHNIAASAAMPHSVGSLPPNATSHAPHDSKARLQNGDETHGFMAKPCTPHLHCAARAALQAANPQCWGSRGTPLAFLLGFQRGYSLWKENIPFDCALPCQWETPPQRFALHPRAQGRARNSPLRGK